MKISWKGFSVKEKKMVTGNPYCGFYTIYRFLAHGDLVWGWDCPLDELKLEDDQSLCLLQFNLVQFNRSCISDVALGRIERTLSWFKGQEKEMIVRFLYDWEGKGMEGEPNDIKIILNHMEQLSPLLKEYSSHIHILQGLFTGSWGEMHNSRFTDEYSMKSLAGKIYEACGDDTYIALRCPAMWRGIFGTKRPLTLKQAYGEDMAARFCLYNDGLLASETDYGTYGEVLGSNSEDHWDRYVRRDEILFQKKLCQYVPNGGETVGLTGYHGFKEARKYFSTLHVSHLNSKYDPLPLDRWRNTKTGIRDSLWRDKSIYEYMASHLGYRLSVDGVKLKRKGTFLNVTIKISNGGFSAPHRPFKAILALKDKDSGKEEYHGARGDMKYLQPGSRTKYSWEIDGESLNGGEYVLGLKIWDPSGGKAIGLANRLPLDYNGVHGLGHFKI